MVELIVLAVILVLAFPVMAIVALVKASATQHRVRAIEAALPTLTARINDLARAVERHSQGQPSSQPEPSAERPAAEPQTPAPDATPSPQAAPPVLPEASAGIDTVPEAAPSATIETAASEPITATAEPSDAAPPGAAPPTAPEPPSRPGFEEQFGTRWVVWIGGVALALGGIFLVRYAIEQDLIAPGVRIALGALLAAALLAAGEWSRRQERLSGFAGIAVANIPAILTAAGTTVAYATVYAAYGLYGFLAPPAAFVLLGIVALASLAAALLHGPALAALGLVGAYVTPLLVASAEPNYWALYIYLAVATFAALALARVRLWRWLAITAIAFSLSWILPVLPAQAALAPLAFHLAAGFILAAALIVSGLAFGPEPAPGRIEAISSGALAAYVVAALLVVLAYRHAPTALTTFTLLAAATVVIAWRAESAAAALPFAAACCAAVIGHWAFDPEIRPLIAPPGPTAGAVPEPLRSGVQSYLALGAFYAALFGPPGYLAQGRQGGPVAPVLWAGAAVLAPLLIMIALYWRIAGFERSIPFASLALLIAALFAVATEKLLERDPRPGSDLATALFAAGSVGALALALTFALEKGWLTVALALTVPGLAWIAAQRPLPLLRKLAAAMTILVLMRIAYEPRILGDDIGTTPLFNWLLWGYGVPAFAFGLGGHLLRKQADDGPARIVDAAAILFTVLLGVFEVRHYVNGGDLYAIDVGLAEVALEVCGALALAIGLERLRLRTGSVVHDIGAQIVAALALAAIVFGLMFAVNPINTGELVGGPFVNLILIGYGLPAVLATILALTARGHRPLFYRSVAVIAAVALALAYLSLEVRTLFHGPDLTEGPAGDAEGYTYSAVWLAFGVILLVIGILLRSQPTRIVSAAVTILTIGKVFLVDLAGLTGIWRALSFIGLGLVLVGIGWLYQRLLFPRRAMTPIPPAPTAG